MQLAGRGGVYYQYPSLCNVRLQQLLSPRVQSHVAQGPDDAIMLERIAGGIVRQDIEDVPVGSVCQIPPLEVQVSIPPEHMAEHLLHRHRGPVLRPDSVDGLARAPAVLEVDDEGHWGIWHATRRLALREVEPMLHGLALFRKRVAALGFFLRKDRPVERVRLVVHKGCAREVRGHGEAELQ